MRKTKLSLVVATILSSAAIPAAVAAEPAGYRVTDVGSVSGAIHTSARAIDNSGRVVGQLADLRGQNIRLDLFDPEDFAAIEDINNPTELQRRQLRDYLLRTVGRNPRFQNLAFELGFLFDGSEISELDGFEVIDEETGLRSDAVSFRVTAANNHGIVVGQSFAPYRWIEALDTDGEMNRFHVTEKFPQAAWTDGINYRLISGEEELLMGGTSSILAINDAHVAVGYAGIANGTNLTSYYNNNCIEQPPEEDEEPEENPNSTNDGDNAEPTIFLPEAACLHTYWWNNSGLSGSSAPLMEERAYRWELDSEGNVLAKRELGLAFDLEADEEDVFITFRYRSVANDINIHGTTVGVSQRQIANGTITRPTLFTEDGAVEMLADEDGRNNSLAIAINDSNIAVGYSNLLINGAFRTRLFYMDVTNGPSTPVYPLGFFSDSAWRPTAINNNGQVVGVGQIDATQGQGAVRRNTAFMYDINTDTIVDLNSYLPCNSEYNILDAVDINDAGEIAVVAVRVVPTTEDGNTQDTAQLRSLILTPDASAEVCQQQDTQNRRRGAANHPIWLATLALFALMTLRRRKVSK